MNNKGRRYSNKRKLSKKKVISFILLLVFLALFIYSAQHILSYFRQNAENQRLTNETSDAINQENEHKYEVDFSALKEKNNDTVGFLKVNGTDVEYVVVQGGDNNFYLKHDFNKQYNVAGWIFADYKNKLDGTDKNTIIYGHNMKTGLMFSSLENILQKEWQENVENRKVVFVTESENVLYEVFSVYQIKDESYYIKTDFQDGEFADFITTVKGRSEFDFGVEVNQEDKMLTLSTCANDSKYRIVLHAKKVVNGDGSD